MRPVDRLCLGRGVPPGVEDEDVVGLGQRQPEAARLEADEERRCVPIPEATDDGLPVLRRPVEVRGAQTRCREGPLDDAEETGELAEDKRPVALGLELLELLDKELDLGGGRLAVMDVVDE